LLFLSVKETREGALDSRFMTLAVSLGAQKTSLLQTDLVAFQPDEFVQKLVWQCSCDCILYIYKQQNVDLAFV